MIAVDTNILIYAHRSQTPEHKKAKQALNRLISESQEIGWGFSYPCVTEFWSIASHPQISGRPSTLKECQSFIASLTMEGGAQIFMPGPEFAVKLMQMAQDLNISGVRIFDLQIALMASDAGVSRLWTHDHNFIKLPGLTHEDPLE